MANLLEQMDILKGLTDQDLQSEVHAPSGSAPPYLVLTELGRRKSMRERYAQDAARYKEHTTVAEDLVKGLPMGATASAPSLGGIDSSAGPAVPGAPGFATGGIVDYADIASKYQDKLAGLGDERKRAQALGLLSIGAAIMSGRHSNTLSNVGEGISAALPGFEAGVNAVDSEERDLLRDLTGVGSAQHADALAEQDRTYREKQDAADEAFRTKQLAQDQSQFDARLGTDKKPADVLKFEYYQSLDEQGKKDFREMYPAFNPNALDQQQLLGAKADAIYADAQKAFPVQSYDTPNEAATKQQQAQAAAYKRIAASYGAAFAAQWAAGMGITIPDGDIAVGGGVDEKDPFGLGL